MTCSIARTLDAVGDRWAVLILRDISFGVRRYDDFRRSTGITNATLSDRLKHLEANGLIARHKYQDGPARYEYALTRRGRDTILLTQALAQIGDKWASEEGKLPPMNFVDRKTRRAVKLGLIDAETREPVHGSDLLPSEGPGADDLIRWRLSHLET